MFLLEQHFNQFEIQYAHEDKKWANLSPKINTLKRRITDFICNYSAMQHETLCTQNAALQENQQACNNIQNSHPLARGCPPHGQ